MAEELIAVPPASSRHTKPVSRNALLWRRLRRRPQFWAGSAVLVLFLLLAVFGNVTNIYGPTDQDIYALSQPPSAQHWFGTDNIGQDLYARVIEGLRKSLIIGLLAGPAATLIAAIVGSSAGYIGGRYEKIVTWLISLLLTLPSFYILMILSPVMKETGWLVIVVFLAAFGWMVMAQIVRNQTKSLRDREFVKAARYMGVSTSTILRRHVIPNVASLLIIDACLGVSSAILAETALSFFGLGIQPPDTSLGTLLQNGQAAAVTRPWLFVFPAAFLIILLTAINLIGDALRDALDPTSEVNRA